MRETNTPPSFNLITAPDGEKYLEVGNCYFQSVPNPFLANKPQSVSAKPTSHAALFQQPAQYSALNTEQRSAYERGIELLDYSGKNLSGVFYHGSPGTGKTAIAVALQKAAEARGLRVFFVDETSLCSKLDYRSLYNTNRERFFADFDLFIFDDMNGATNMIERGTMCVFFTSMHETQKKVIITSNHSYEAFISRNFDVKVIKAVVPQPTGFLKIFEEPPVETRIQGSAEKMKLVSRFTAAIKDESVFHFTGIDLRQTRGF